jgi:hypothetical protein
LEFHKRKAASALLDLDKEINKKNHVSFDEDLEKKRITENTRARLELKKIEQQKMKNKKEAIISSSAFGTFGTGKIKLNNNRNNLLSSEDEENCDIEEITQNNEDDEEDNGEENEDENNDNEPMIIMSRSDEKEINKKNNNIFGDEKDNNNNNSQDDDLEDFVADEQFYKGYLKIFFSILIFFNF